MVDFSLGIAVIIQLIEQYDYLAIFLLMLGEATILPIPSEIVLPFAGFLVWSGKLDPVLGFLTAVLAAAIGSIMMFAAGKFFTQLVVLRYGKKFETLNIKNYASGVRWFKKYGTYFAFVTKLLPVVRSIASAFCGAYKMNFYKFLLYTLAGITIWTAMLITLGYYVSNDWLIIGVMLQNMLIYPLVAFLLIMLLVIFRKRVFNFINALKDYKF